MVLPCFLRRKRYSPARAATTKPAPRPETMPAIEALLMGCAPMLGLSFAPPVCSACDIELVDVPVVEVDDVEVWKVVGRVVWVGMVWCVVV